MPGDAGGVTPCGGPPSGVNLPKHHKERNVSRYMPTLEKIENDVKQLSKADQEALRDWLENMLEDELEFTDEFKAKIERGEQDIQEGRIRVRTVRAGQ